MYHMSSRVHTRLTLSRFTHFVTGSIVHQERYYIYPHQYGAVPDVFFERVGWASAFLVPLRRCGTCGPFDVPFCVALFLRLFHPISLRATPRLSHFSPHKNIRLFLFLFRFPASINICDADAPLADWFLLTFFVFSRFSLPMLRRSLSQLTARSQGCLRVLLERSIITRLDIYSCGTLIRS